MVIRREVSYNREIIMVISLTKKQKDILIGNLLGDGGIYTGNSGKSNYYIKQSLKYKDYVFWLYNELKNICPSSPKQRKDNGQWYFYSSQLMELTEIQKLFYLERKKRVPLNIGDILFSPLSVAIWYMDDGTLDYRPKDHYAFYLATHSFSVEDTYRLVAALRDNFGIESTVYNNLIRGKRYPRIVIGPKGRDKFLKLVKPYMLKCFEHKLPPLL